MKPIFDGGLYAPLSTRRISEETCKKWGYQQAKYNGKKPCQVANYKDADGKVVAQKLRFADKTFTWLGEPKKAGLYGQWLWKEGRGKLVITEGELDALSVSQVQNHKWPVVSIPNGAQGAAKDIGKQLEFVESFDEVILMFDHDEPGREASIEVAQMLSPGKAKIASLPLKDANECLQNGKGADIVSAIFNAKEWRPDEIIAGDELWERIVEYNPVSNGTPYPWIGLNDMTFGLRPAELVMLTAGSGIGKSAICRELCHHLLVTHQQRVGYIALEEQVEKSALGVMSVDLSRKLHIDKGDLEELKASYERSVGSGRWFTYDHFGSMESDRLLQRIRYMVRGLGCKWIFLDHISIVISGDGEGDERRMIDNLMTKLRSLAQELGCGIIAVTHLKRKDGKPLEEGGEISLGLLRGSGAIAQLSDCVLGFERDQQDEETKHITTVRVLKNRFDGDTGVACTLKYNPETGRLKEDIEGIDAETESDPLTEDPF